MLLLLAIPAAFTYTFGQAVNDRRQGWTLFAVMFLLFAGGSLISNARFGVAGSALLSVVSTASRRWPNLVQLLNLKTGEVIFGGTGSGILSMILMVLVAVFLAGLMVGRSPEYLGKCTEAEDIKMVMLALVVAAAANLGNRGPHGLSEVLYANASAVGTNGSAIAGRNANTPFFNRTLGLEMALAGNLARKRRVPVTIGSMPTHGVVAGADHGALPDAFRSPVPFFRCS